MRDTPPKTAPDFSLVSPDLFILISSASKFDHARRSNLLFLQIQLPNNFHAIGVPD
jgi:hypothetical protein